MKAVARILSGAVLCAAIVPVASMAAGNHSGINQREHNQQARINQGVRSGELTRHEATNLEQKEAKIKVNERYDKMNGKFTPAERAHLQKELNGASRDIYRDKHNNSVH
ncbi:MAG TPA: hypothetical protein VGK48_01000 [Terriglobia bacterium]|jgi:hypothetical protein